jgi:hypothetical protein
MQLTYSDQDVRDDHPWTMNHDITEVVFPGEVKFLANEVVHELLDAFDKLGIRYRSFPPAIALLSHPANPPRGPCLTNIY